MSNNTPAALWRTLLLMLLGMASNAAVGCPNIPYEQDQRYTAWLVDKVTGRRIMDGEVVPAYTTVVWHGKVEAYGRCDVTYGMADSRCRIARLDPSATPARPTRVTRPDTRCIGYEYDAAHRQTAVLDNRGNRTECTLDNAGNKTAAQIKDPGGALKRTLARSIDALGRVEHTTGRE